MCFVPLVPQLRPLFEQINCQKCSGPEVAFHILTSKCASRHNRVQFSHPARWLCTRRFSEPTFQASGAPKHWKDTVLRGFSTFSRTFIFLLLTVFSLTLPTPVAASVHKSKFDFETSFDKYTYTYIYIYPKLPKAFKTRSFHHQKRLYRGPLGKGPYKCYRCLGWFSPWPFHTCHRCTNSPHTATHAHVHRNNTFFRPVLWPCCLSCLPFSWH